MQIGKLQTNTRKQELHLPPAAALVGVSSSQPVDLHTEDAATGLLVVTAMTTLLRVCAAHHNRK